MNGPVRLITAQDSRVAYGADGDQICLPQIENIIQTAEGLVNY